MSDTPSPNGKKSSIALLSDFSHRPSTPPAIFTPDDLITEPTPAQRERLVYLVDNALNALEDGMEPGNKIADRVNAANSVLDRAGVSAKSALMQRTDESMISAEALTQVIGGLAKMFGAKGSIKEPKDVTQAVPIAAQLVKSEHGHSLQPAKEEEEQPVEEGKEVKRVKSKMPDSLLRSYGAQVEEDK